jgi:hypothetical protein
MDGEERDTPQVEIPPQRLPLRRGAPLAVLGLVIAAIVGAVALAQGMPSVVQPPISILVPTPLLAPVATPPAGPVQTPGQPPDAVPPRLKVADLTAAVGNGSLDGRLVFIDGTLTVDKVPCEPPGGGRGRPCVELAVPGLGIEVRPEPVAMPWRGIPPAGAWIVTVARDGRLGYLGSLLPSRVTANDATELVARLLNGDLPSRGSLFQLDGFLVANSSEPCERPDPSPTTPCPAPFLAAEEPSEEGVPRSNRGADVELPASVVDIDPGDIVTPGTFLLTPPEACDLAEATEACADQNWTVVARYEPARSVRVLVP